MNLAKKFHLDPRQIELMNFVMLPKAFRPHRKEIIARLGITEPTYYHWIRHPRFNDARREFVKQYYKDDIPDILMALKDEAIAGNPVAAKLFLEYVDDFNKDERKSGNNPDDSPGLLKTEVKIIINQLTQKLYGTEKQPIRDTEIETQYEFRGSSLPAEIELQGEAIEVAGQISRSDLQE